MKNNEDISKLGKIYIPYNCQFIIIKKLKYNYELSEIYKLKPDNKLIFTKFAIYSNKLFPDLNFYKERINLQGINFAMTYSAVSSK